MTFEEKLKHYRKQAGLSQEKMAELIGVSRQAVTKWETGTGVPDISNLIAISELFQVSLDDLLLDEKMAKAQTDFIYNSSTEYDIDRLKHFDIKLGGAKQVIVKAVNSEKIKIRLASNTLKTVAEELKLKIDDVRNKIDLDIHKSGKLTEAVLKDELTIFLYLPQKYLGKVELEVNCKQLKLSHIANDSFELDGKVSEVTIDGGQGEIELNSNLDMMVTVLAHKGGIALNQISSTSTIQVPADYPFQAVKKGIATRMTFEEMASRQRISLLKRLKIISS
nr:helix-turn-helix transcriptional regulator [Streptococcus devriesei]